MPAVGAPHRPSRSFMNVILLGAPGSGKGTQAQHDLPRAAGAAGLDRRHHPRGDPRTDRAGARVQVLRRRGRARSRRPGQPAGGAAAWPSATARAGFLLDGYPRTRRASRVARRRARRAAAAGSTASSRSTVEDAVILERITGRRSDPGDGPHLSPDVRPAAGGDRAEARAPRPDDTEAVLRRRLDEYREKTAPIVPYYERRSLLRRVNGEGAVADVKRRVLEALGLQEAAAA
ncbi:MAG: nucleoside monophosphate kinase [Desulfobacterales bacterium]|nr:nucleoside monophosphate kinase [Desulfobacterales bacterium]